MDIFLVDFLYHVVAMMNVGGNRGVNCVVGIICFVDALNDMGVILAFMNDLFDRVVRIYAFDSGKKIIHWAIAGIVG